MQNLGGIVHGEQVIAVNPALALSRAAACKDSTHMQPRLPDGVNAVSQASARDAIAPATHIFTSTKIDKNGTGRSAAPVLLLRWRGNGVAIVATKENNWRFGGRGPAMHVLNMFHSHFLHKTLLLPPLSHQPAPGPALTC